MVALVVMGAGLIGYRHILQVNAASDCHLVGVIEPDATRHKDDGHRYFTSLDEIDEPVDGVIIATPTGLHFEHAKQAIERGWHMLIEKPVTATPEEADALIPLVKEAGVHCLVGHHRRYHPALQQLKSWVAEGQFGQIIGSSLLWGMRKPDDYFADNWRTKEGSPVMINTIHDIDALRFVLGEITAIQAIGNHQIRGAARVETAAALLTFAQGTQATILISDVALSPWGFEAGIGENPHIGTTGQDMWWLLGTKGSVSFPSLTRWGQTDDWSAPAQPQGMTTQTVTPLAEQIRHFIAVIKSEQQPLITVEDAAASLKATWQLENMLQQQLKTQEH